MRCLACLLLVSCAHATRTETAHPAAAAPASAPTAGEKSGRAVSRLERKPAHPGEALVTSSPASLLEKGAAEKIQQALNSHGVTVKETGELDDQTSEGLRRFQKKQDIASHGMPDELTLTRLGLDPRKLYRSNAAGDKEKNEKRAEEQKR